MKRKRPCIVPKCSNFVETGNRSSKCSVHADRPWAGSAERRAAAGALTGWAWTKLANEVLERDRYICTRCGRRAEEVDHVIPISEGGTDHPDNLRSLCSLCHETLTHDQIAARRRGDR